MTEILVVIPAREAAQRLPGKPLADIAGVPMIVHVWRRAIEADIGRVVVATDSAKVHDAIAAAGGTALMTREDHVCGSDRVYEALCKADEDGRVDVVVNLQGDLPTLDPHLIRACVEPLMGLPEDGAAADMATLGAEICDEAERMDPNVVKAVGTPVCGQERILRALYFTRACAPYGDGPLYHHIGVYAYRRAALAKFVSLPPSPLEKREKLEQLRALEAGMRIDIALVDTVPLGVDTPADLARARALIGS